jgi:hypothetical protein
MIEFGVVIAYARLEILSRGAELADVVPMSSEPRSVRCSTEVQSELRRGTVRRRYR